MSLSLSSEVTISDAAAGRHGGGSGGEGGELACRALARCRLRLAVRCLLGMGAVFNLVCLVRCRPLRVAFSFPPGVCFLCLPSPCRARTTRGALAPPSDARPWFAASAPVLDRERRPPLARLAPVSHRLPRPRITSNFLTRPLTSSSAMCGRISEDSISFPLGCPCSAVCLAMSMVWTPQSRLPRCGPTFPQWKTHRRWTPASFASRSSSFSICRVCRCADGRYSPRRFGREESCVDTRPLSGCTRKDM
jgi:hypothetical protein